MKITKILLCLLAVVLVFSGCVNGEEQVTTTIAPISTEVVSTTVSTVTTTVNPTVTASQTETTTKEVQTSEKTTAPTTADSTTTERATETSAPSEVFSGFCTVTVDCRTARENIDKIKKSKVSFVPENGIILDKVVVGINEGETAFDALKRACKENVCTDNCKYCRENGVQLEYNHSVAFNTYYVEGIHQIYEKDCGSLSGWVYSVNGEFPNVGSSAYNIKPGDSIVFYFTCDMGEDIGKTF